MFSKILSKIINFFFFFLVYGLLSFRNFKLILQTIEIKGSAYSEWIKDLNLGGETVKLLEENMREKLHGLGFGHDFWVVIPKI